MGVLTPPSAAIDAAERCEYAATSNANSETRPLGPYEQHGDMNAGRDVLGAIQEAIRHNTVQLQQRAERGELLVVEDLLENVPDLPDETQIFCVDGKLSSDPAEFPSEHLSPGLSFLWTSTGLEKFVSNTNLQKSISEFRLFRKHEQICIGAASYLYTPNDSSIAAIVDMLSFSVAILSKYSLNALNKSREPLDALRRELILAVEEASGRFGLSDLAVFLKQKTQIDFGLIHLAKSRAAPSVRTITVSARLQPTFFVLLSEFLGVSRELFDGDSECVTNNLPTITLPPTPGSELIVNAGMWGKPLASVVSARTRTRILIMPITRPHGPRLNYEDYATLAAPDLLFTFMTDLDLNVMQRLHACVDTFSHHRFGARRFNLLARLQSQKAESPEINLRLRPFCASSESSSVESALNPLLNEVLYTTSAHSVSVRLYDPRIRALVVAASASAEAGKPDMAPADGPIWIKSSVNSSVVVCTFLNATARDPYLYIPRIIPPIMKEVNGRLKTYHRTVIPDTYKTLGLQRCLLTRSTTRSEICFALMAGHFSIGTFNLEAPYPLAFEQDIAYLNLVRIGIEKLYSASDQEIDGRWLITGAARSDSLHQLWQYQESGSFFSEKQLAVLRSIFPSRSQNVLDGFVDLISIRVKTINWIEARWDGELRSSVIKMTKFDHVSDCKVDAYFFEATFVILKNIIQNAVKYGDPTSDLLFIDDRAWFGCRQTPRLRIYYRSSNSVPQEKIRGLGIAPIEQPLQRRVAYGMYTVGLLTRLLGGRLHVSSQGVNSLLAIEAHLPFPEC